MPFKSRDQEVFLKINNPKLWREWVKKYGHYPTFSTTPKNKRKKLKKTTKSKRFKK